MGELNWSEDVDEAASTLDMDESSLWHPFAYACSGVLCGAFSYPKVMISTTVPVV